MSDPQPQSDRPDVRKAAPKSNAPAKTEAAPLRQLGDWLRGQSAALAVGIYKGLNPARMIDIVCSAASRSPDLLRCTPLSIYAALKQCAQIGLEPMTPQRHAYLVPFRNKNGSTEAQLIIGYQGLCEIALRHERIKAVRANVVYDGDDYEITLEPPSVRHEWTFDRDPDAEILGAYAIAELTTGALAIDVMTRDEIEAIRKRSRAKDSGPWITDYAAMARKTVIRRLLQRGSVPMSSELGMALDQDNDRDDEEVVRSIGATVRDVVAPAGETSDEPTEANPLGHIDLDPSKPDKEKEKPKEAAPRAKPNAEVAPHVYLIDAAKDAGVNIEHVLQYVSQLAHQPITGTKDLATVDPKILNTVIDWVEKQTEP